MAPDGEVRYDVPDLNDDDHGTHGLRRANLFMTECDSRVGTAISPAIGICADPQTGAACLPAA